MRKLLILTIISTILIGVCSCSTTDINETIRQVDLER